MLRPFAILALMLPAACASVTSGNTQNIDVSTNPPGASCVLSRNGAELGRVSPTPGTLLIDRSTRAIDVACTRPGHQPASARVDSSFQPTTLGNILIGGVVGVVVDASTGAINRYPESVAVTLPPVPEGVAPVSAPPAAIVPPSGPRGG